MTKSLGIGAASLSALALLVVTARQATTQVGSLPAFVRLQSSTPGTAQTGHSNITGTAIAGQFVGGGAGLTSLNASNISSGTLNLARLPANVAFLIGTQTFTGSKTFSNTAAFTNATSPFTVSASGLVANLNADFLDGLSASDFLQSVPNPLTLTANSATHVIRGENTDNSGFSYGVHGRSNSTSGRGVFGEATAPGGVGIWGEANQTVGTGVYGSGASFGVQGRTINSTGIGVSGISTAQGGVAVRGEANQTSGVGVHGFGFVGVRGSGSNSSGSTGGDFTSASANGTAVSGVAQAVSSTTYGGRFESRSTSGYGVYGEATATSGTIYGVFGSASTAAGGYAVYANGDSGASGVKSFRIDHPSDPENKYLLHYSSESPFPQNFYSGNVITDAQGKAWVELPAYFHDINANYKYQLTVVDNTESTQFVQVKVAREIANGRFMVMTSSPNIKVSWRIEADRNDARVKARCPVDVQEKTGAERGKYQHPEYYGKPASMGMDYAPRTDARGQNRTVRP